eukprot:UN06118
MRNFLYFESQNELCFGSKMGYNTGKSFT